MTKRTEQLEKRKRQCWVYLLGYYVDYDVLPTLQEIADNAFEGKITYEGARYILKLLEADGKIKIIKGKRRGIILTAEMKGGKENGI